MHAQVGPEAVNALMECLGDAGLLGMHLTHVLVVCSVGSWALLSSLVLMRSETTCRHRSSASIPKQVVKAEPRLCASRVRPVRVALSPAQAYCA